MKLLSLSTAAARRVRLAFFCAALGLLVAGCASTPEGAPVHGKDPLLSFLASKDGRKIVIAGEKYHYVFGGDPAVASMLRWDSRAKITPALLGELKVARDQSLEGQYMLLAFDADLTPEEQAFLVQTGFGKAEVKYGDRTGTALRYFGTVTGTRYAAKPLRAAEMVDFSRSHDLRYVEQETASGPATAPAPAPLSYSADGAPLVEGVPVAVVQGGTDYTCRARIVDFCVFR
ncbi:hypothetical protein [Acidovorax cavernicola]|uniref:DUF4852 domain-containing protein n=1 Tax=Acidovorax cavernicola TaxID=1675792 RepID=A0A9X8D6K8_9BURK|nr:hypothetical protein [Acidovorax cavernicola]RIX82319.1 hypothetical protein D3H34_08595 [Acidovorax cavernicola]